MSEDETTSHSDEGLPASLPEDKEDTAANAHATAAGVANKMAGSGYSPHEILMSMSHEVGGNPLHRKMTPEHITQVLNFTEQHDEREYNALIKQQELADKQDARRHLYHAILFIVILIVILIVIFLFRNQSDVLIPLVIGVCGFVGGTGYAKFSGK